MKKFNRKVQNMEQEHNIFTTAPQLEQCSTFIMALSLSDLRLKNDSRFGWLMLIPRQVGAVELFDLSPSAQQQLMAEITDISKIVKEVWQADKINVASFGNMVSQLHIHIIARHKGDIAWPGSAFDFQTPISYAKDEQQQRLQQCLQALHRMQTID